MCVCVRERESGNREDTVGRLNKQNNEQIGSKSRNRPITESKARRRKRKHITYTEKNNNNKQTKNCRAGEGKKIETTTNETSKKENK